MEDPSLGGPHDRPRFDHPHRPPARPRRRRPPPTRRPSSAPATRSGRTACSPATSACGRRDPRVGEAIAERLGWLDAPAHFTDRIAGLEAFGDAVVDEGYTTAVVAGMGGSSLAPDVLHRTFGSHGGLPRPAHPRLDRPGLRVGDARRPRPAPDARHRRLEVGHDDRAERLPRLRLGPRRGARSKAVPHHAYEHPGALLRGRSPTRARASRRSPTTTSSARSSSTRPTSAAATRR